MGEDTLLALASTYLLSQEGKKLTDGNLDISSFRTQIENKLKENIQSFNSEEASTKPNYLEKKGKKQDKKKEIQLRLIHKKKNHR